MYLRLAYRFLREVSPRLLWKAGRLWAMGSARALKAYEKRREGGEIFPPFLFLALTSACNLRCRGCWVETRGPSHDLSRQDLESIVRAGRQRHVSFYTLLGGEPLLYPGLWDFIGAHPDCYFQLMTNGMHLDDSTVSRISELGNISPLVSLDGLQAENDARRGDGTFAAAVEGIERLQRARTLFGVATVVTGKNLEEVLSDEYVRFFIDRGAMYLWYYLYRPVGADPSPEFCVRSEQVLPLRQRLLGLRRRHPILLIDTYWDADGRAVCPASAGLGFHIGPRGSVEPCPPLSFADQIAAGSSDPGMVIENSRLLRDFRDFVQARTRGCVILERPAELAEFLRESGAVDYSGRDMIQELAEACPRASHHQPGAELPEDMHLYRLLKRQLFFGMGGYG